MFSRSRRIDLSNVEPGRARDFFDWLAATRPQYASVLVENECVDWESLREIDGEALGYMDIRNQTHQAEIVSMLAQLGGGSTSNIESGRARQLFDWISSTYPNKNYTDLLEANGLTNWQAISGLTQKQLARIGIRAFGVQKKILRQIEALEDEPGAGGEDSKEPDVRVSRGGRRPAPRTGPRPRVGLVLLGETGAGKSTFYQSLMDHARGVPFERIRETERNPDVKDTESQTKSATKHECVARDYALHVIDTPGIGDTMGVDEDQRHVENITKFLSEDCDFNAICMVIKNGANRATARMQYIVSEIKSHLTRDVWPHVFTVVTRCASNRFPGDDTCAVIDLLGLPGPNSENKFFMIDNYAYERIDERRRPPKYLQAKKCAYNEAGSQLEEIIQAALRLPMKTGTTIGRLRTHRISCKEKARLMQAKIDSMNSETMALRQAESDLQGAQSQKKLNAGYSSTYTVYETVPHTMPNGGKATVCGICHNRCHDPCHVNRQGDVSSCCAISGDHCNRCNHHKGSHHHSNTYFRKEAKTKSTLDAAAKARYDAAVGKERKQQVLQQTLRGRIQALEREKNVLTEQIAAIYAEIDTLAVASFNEYFPKYIEELIADVESKRLPREEKNRQVADLRRQIQLYDESKRAYKRAADRRRR